MLRNLFIVLLAMLIAVLVRKYLLGTLGTRVVWITFYPMVVLVALRCGCLTELFSAVTSCLIAVYGWHLLADQPLIKNYGDQVGMLAFLLTCVIISIMAEIARRTGVQAIHAKERAEAVNEQLLSEIAGLRQTEMELEATNRKLEAFSVTDGLTGIANRRRFDEVLVQEYARLGRSSGELSLIMLDVDNFKGFNDNYGHVSGDDCLRQIAQVLEDSTDRPADLAARYGGEEFACILPETDQRGALLISERIRQGIVDLAIRHDWSDAADCVTASLGVVTIHWDTVKKAPEIVAQADELLYRAKSNGRNRVECNDVQPVPERANTNLMQMVWKDAYCSGNQLIDAQHQSLFKVASEVLEATFVTRQKELILSTVTRLLDDIAQHFRDEEHFLKSVGFPDMKQHAKYHAKLLNKGFELVQGFTEDKLAVGDILQYLVGEVVMQHLLGDDKDFFEFTRDAVAAGRDKTLINPSEIFRQE